MENRFDRKYKDRFIFLALTLIPILAFLISITLGRYSISVKDIFNIIWGKIAGKEMDYPKVIDTVIFNVRIPRVIVAMIVGASLSVSGAVYQGMFRNPMVSPDILGTSAGAGFGAALAILLSMSTLATQVMSFTFGLLAVMLTYLISSKISKREGFMFVLILSGMLVGTIFQSFISISKYIADTDNKLPAITFWLMGSLAAITKRDAKMIIIPFLLGIIPLYMVRWKLNTLSFGEEEARSMGVDTRKLRFLVIICSTILTASAVSISGMIGWIGLIIPHIARLIVGPDFKKLIPASILIGSTYLLIVDNIARTISSIEIPLGILTSLIGAPFFIYLLFRTRTGWN